MDANLCRRFVRQRPDGRSSDRRSGADVSVVFAHSGDTLLHLAVTLFSDSSSASIVRRLVAAGADARAVNLVGQTAFHIAACNTTASNALGGVGDDFYQEDKEGKSPIALAVAARNVPCLEAMFAAGANPEYVSARGSSLLHFYFARDDDGVHKCCAGFIRWLVAAGVNVNARDAEGEIAYSRTCTTCMLAMFSVGADFAEGMKSADVDSDMWMLLLAVGVDVPESLFHGDKDFVNKKELATLGVRLVRARLVEVCIGLQSLRLAALQLCEIMLYACQPASILTPFHELWNVAVAVKHFRQQPQVAGEL